MRIIYTIIIVTTLIYLISVLCDSPGLYGGPEIKYEEPEPTILIKDTMNIKLLPRDTMPYKGNWVDVQ